jgi:insulysin
LLLLHRDRLELALILPYHNSLQYYFEVAPNALQGALDRFAGFFSEPLFAEDCTEREANAVNSEHKKNLQSDMWRFYQLEKHLSSPEHPYHKFGTGSLETLWTTPKSQDRDPRAELIEWWKKEYCASRMKLVVLGKEDLDTLEGWVRERFEKVEHKGKEKVMYSDKVFEEGEMGVSLSIARAGERVAIAKLLYISTRSSA